MKPIEIFRSGTHTSSKGSAFTFSDADLAAIVAGYDPKLHHAPIVVGHPKQDAPAYGWVDGLAIKGDRLVALPADLDAAFSDLVKEKKFRKVSAAFYGPNSANNPTPGSYYLRHVGFLGAAAPAVKGLKPIEFADDELVIEFDDLDFVDWTRQSWALDAMARIGRGIRDYLIQSSDTETADKFVSQWDLDQITQASADLRAEDRAEGKPYFAETPPKGTDMTDLVVQATSSESDLATRLAELEKREAAFAEKQAQTRATEDAAFVDSVVQAGRLPKGLQATATALFADLGDEELTFADGDDTQTTTPREAFRDLLTKLPVPVSTTEFADGDAVDFADAEAVAAAVEKEVQAAKAKGEIITPAVAASRLNLPKT